LPKAYILLSCESGSDNYIISNLKTIETVREAYGTLGTFDVIAKLESDSEDKLKEIITKKNSKSSKNSGNSNSYSL